MRRRRSQPDGIDISPLIDVVFILLIFFMVSTTFVKDREVDIERPRASSSTPASSEALRVVVDRTASIAIDGAPVQLWMVQSHVRDHVRSHPDAPVLVVTDRLVTAERLIEVVDQCRLGGAADVGVLTEAEAG